MTKLNQTLMFIVMGLMCITVLIVWLTRKPPAPLVIPGEVHTIIEWKEKIVPVDKWNEVQVMVPYPVPGPTTIDTLWLTPSGYKVFNVEKQVSTYFTEKQLPGVLKINLAVHDSVVAYTDEEANIYLDKTSSLNLLSYEFIKTHKPAKTYIELRGGISATVDKVKPRFSLALERGFGIIYVDSALDDAGIGIGVRF